MAQRKSLIYRIWPLFAAKFLLRFVLWYAIEKLFLGAIGFDDSGVAMIAAIYASVSLAVEVPSGVLADRWSRKGVWVLAALALAMSSFLP